MHYTHYPLFIRELTPTHCKLLDAMDALTRDIQTTKRPGENNYRYDILVGFFNFTPSL